MENQENYTGKKTSPVTIGFAWLIVSIPLMYGIYFTALKAAALFTVVGAK
ncbi:MAG: hypothetical protein H7Z37_04465 [Pyrinomonadaceae bacterium]|nr:hypothetical protein [Pyrinomonadaceae bacterium]